MNDKMGAAADFNQLVDDISSKAVLKQRATAATILKMVMQDNFLADEFARKVKRNEFRIPPPTNFVYAATTAFADSAAAWTYQCPSDRYAIVWGMGFEVHGLTTALNSAFLDGPERQLRALANVTLRFPVAKALSRAYGEFDLGAIDVSQDGVTTLVAVSMAQKMLRERFLRSITNGVPLGGLNPNDYLYVDIAGLNGVTVADSGSGVTITQYMLLEEFPTS